MVYCNMERVIFDLWLYVIYFWVCLELWEENNMSRLRMGILVETVKRRPEFACRAGVSENFIAAIAQNHRLNLSKYIRLGQRTAAPGWVLLLIFLSIR